MGAYAKACGRLATGALALTLMCTGTTAHAAFNVPGSTTTISSADWARFIRLAHANNGDGVVNLPGNRITAAPCVIETPGTTIRGRGRNATVLLPQASSQRAVFFVRANNASLLRMQITGRERVVLTGLRAEGSRFLRDRPTLSAGLLNGIRIDRGFRNFRMTDSFIRDVNVGIEFERHSLPDGFTLRRVDFSVGSGMVICTARRETLDRQGETMNRRMLLDGVRHVNRDGELSDNNRNLGIRGLVFDFGNNRSRPNLRAVDMNGSLITNCNFIRTAKWNLDINRGSNVLITENRFEGGGYENETFIHALHFEDAGNVNQPIRIIDNFIRQRRRASTGTVITGAVTPAHIWLGVTFASRAPALEIRGNTYRGVSRSLLLVKQNAGFDDQRRDIAVEVPSTVGSDVPANQQGRARGPANRR